MNPGWSLVERCRLLDELFDVEATIFGADLGAYRHHCYRVVNFALAFAPAAPDVRAKIEIAAYFHDVGIWADGTFDYLEPSIARARAYLRARGQESWLGEVEPMIARHHQITSAPRTGPLVDAFRRADWIDVSLGVLRLGLPATLVADVRRAFPNAGFHRRLAELTARRARHHPLSPLPMLRW